MKKEIIQNIKSIVLALVLVLGVSYVYAWTGPTGTPPNDNAPAPLNVSGDGQSKIGGLNLNTANSAAPVGLFVGCGSPCEGDKGKVGIGTSPYNRLDVNGNVGIKAGYRLLLYNSTNGSYAGMYLKDDGVVRVNYAFASDVGVQNPVYADHP